mgnify:CR=1 FL=1
MNIIKIFSDAQKLGKLLVILMLLVSVSVTFAQSGNIISAIQDLCKTAKGLLGAAAMVLIVLAAITYAIGQVMGAETRARAAVWATSMMIGAVIGMVIYLILPGVIAVLFGSELATGQDPCEFVGSLS